MNNEISLEVSHGDFSGIHDEFAPAKDPGTRGDESGAELHENVEEVEEVGEGAEEGDGPGGVVVSGHAGGATDVRQVEVEGIDKEGDEASDEEHVVPPVDDFPVGVEDLIPP